MHIALNLGPQKQMNEDIEDNLKTEEKIGDQNAEPTTVDASAESPKKGDKKDDKKKKEEGKEEKKEETKTTAFGGTVTTVHESGSGKGTPPKEEAKQEENVLIT